MTQKGKEITRIDSSTDKIEPEEILGKKGSQKSVYEEFDIQKDQVIVTKKSTRNLHFVK